MEGRKKGKGENRMVYIQLYSENTTHSYSSYFKSFQPDVKLDLLPDSETIKLKVIASVCIIVVVALVVVLVV